MILAVRASAAHITLARSIRTGGSAAVSSAAIMVSSSRDYIARERPDVHVKRHLPQNRADRSRIARNALHQRATEDSARFRHMCNDPARHFEAACPALRMLRARLLFAAGIVEQGR